MSVIIRPSHVQTGVHHVERGIEKLGVPDKSNYGAQSNHVVTVVSATGAPPSNEYSSHEWVVIQSEASDIDGIEGLVLSQYEEVLSESNVSGSVAPILVDVQDTGVEYESDDDLIVSGADNKTMAEYTAGASQGAAVTSVGFGGLYDNGGDIGVNRVEGMHSGG